MEPDPPNHQPVGLIGNLFNATLDSCANACQRLASTEQSRQLRYESERFFLWGDGVFVTDGQLDKALTPSSELYQTTLSALYELGKVINDDLTKAVAPIGLANPLASSRELQLLLKEASAILDEPNATGDPESLSDDESGPHSLEDVLCDMGIYIDCLMDLALALENAVVYPESIPFESASIEPTIFKSRVAKLAHTLFTLFNPFASPDLHPHVSEPPSPVASVDRSSIFSGIFDSGPFSFQAEVSPPSTAPSSRKSRTDAHHCPGAKLDGKCRWSKSSPRYCKTHQKLCRIHNWAYLKDKGEKCPHCPRLLSCRHHPDVQYFENESCPSCQAEQAAAEVVAAAAADPNTCPYREWGQCRWKKRLQYCTNHQEMCPMHHELYDKYYGCQSCQAGV